jgi:hypothetical protein
MDELRVIGIEQGALLVVSDDGVQYRIPLDEALRARMRQAAPETGDARKPAPKEIQAHIRAGMSAEDVAAVTGASLDYIQRFEGPVLAEREYVIESALNVPVSSDADLAGGPVGFGAAIRQRLLEAGALAERWASWKEQGGGWIVKLTFVAAQVEHDARWTYDPKRQSLAPINAEAASLSARGDMPAPLVPRLRAVTPAEAGESLPTRFDSGAFAVSPGDTDTGPLLEQVPYGRAGTDETAPLLPVPPAAPAPSASAPSAKTEPKASNQTADLLEALRRRRGERDPMNPDFEESIASHPSTGTVRLVDIPLGTDAPAPSASKNSTDGVTPLPKSRKGRASMPSWDDIVFGARPDED